MSDYEYDSGNESSNEEDDDDLEEDDGVLLALEPESNHAEQDSLDYDDYPHSVFNCDQIIEEMIASIREVNTVVQVSGSTLVFYFDTSSINQFYQHFSSSSFSCRKPSRGFYLTTSSGTRRSCTSTTTLVTRRSSSVRRASSIRTRRPVPSAVVVAAVAAAVAVAA